MLPMKNASSFQRVVNFVEFWVRSSSITSDGVAQKAATREISAPFINF